MLPLESLYDVQAMLNTGGEDQYRLAILGLGDDFIAGSADQIVAVHQFFGLASNELAAPDVQAAGVHLGDSCLCSQRTEIAVADQFLDTDLIADAIEEVIATAD